MSQEWIRGENNVWRCGERFYVSLLPFAENFQMEKRTTKKAQIRIQMQADTRNTLEAIAKKRNVSVSTLIGQILDDYVKRERSGKNGPAHDHPFLWRELTH